jgi:hypothetical protein
MKASLSGNIEKQELENLYLWRYIDSEKLLDFITNNQIHFSRLDQFEDPLEGLENQARYNLKLHNTTDNEQLLSFFKLKSKDEIKKWQNGIFASCWFLPSKDSESLAMWNLYSNKNGFAIKIKLSSLIESYKMAIENLIDKEVIESFYGKVYYLDYFAVNDHANLDSRLLTSMIKSPDYEHEKEFRFIFLRMEREKTIEDRKSIKLNFDTELIKNSSIIAHADMGELTFNLYKKDLFEYGYNLVRSKILTRTVVNKLLK